MAKLTLDTIAKYDEISKINSNFDKIEAELQNKVLYRNNPVGEPNTIEGDVDFNNKNVFNVNEVRASDIFIDGTSVTSSVQASQAAAAASATAAASSAASASSSATAAAISASQAAAAADFIPEIANYAALRAYSGVLTEFYVKGVSVIFDGGAGVFRVDAADTTSADNGGTMLVDALGRRWKREYSGALFAEWFGALGDGVSDDRLAILSAVVAAHALNVPLQLGGKIYYVSDELDLRAYYGVSIIGQGSNYDGPSSVILSGATNKQILRVWGPVVLRDFCLKYTTQQANASTNSIALEFNKISGADIRNIRASYAQTSFGIAQAHFSGSGNWIFDSNLSSLISDSASECHYDFRNFSSGGTNCRIGPLHINGGGTLDFVTPGQSCSYGIRGLGWQGYELSAVSIDGTIINTVPVDLYNCIFDWGTLRFEACTFKSELDGFIKLSGGYQIGRLGVADFKNCRWSPASATSMFIYRTSATVVQFEATNTRIQSDCAFGASGTRRILTNSAAESGTGYTNSVKIGFVDDQGAQLSDSIWTDSISTHLTPVREMWGTQVNALARPHRSAAVKRVVYATAVPTSGTWVFGDIVRILGAAYGTPHEYICAVAGTPGTWRPSAQTVAKNVTASRPTLRADDMGVMYMDTTLAATGKPIWWNGTAWVDSTGATV